MTKKIALLLLVFGLMASFLAGPLVRSLVYRQLKSYFSDSRGLFAGDSPAKISVGRLSIEKSWSLALSNIQIQSMALDLTVKKCTLSRSLRVTLVQPQIRLHRMPTFKKTAENHTTPIPFIRSIEIQDLDFRCDLPDWTMDLKGSLGFDTKEMAVYSATLHSDSLKYKELEASNISIVIPHALGGRFSILKLRHGKAEIENITGQVILKENTVRIESLSGSWIGGNISGWASLAPGNNFEYQTSLEMTALDLQRFTSDFELQDKMSAKGKLVGQISLQGDLAGLKQIAGHLTDDGQGGDLVIENKDFLDKISQNTRQPIELVEAGFKEYHFDEAMLSLAMDDKDLNFSVNLNGPKGKRDFQSKWHDLF